MKKLGMIDDTFLRLESRRQPLHVGVLMLFEPPAGARGEFAAQLAEKLRQSTRAAPPFNWRLVRRNGLHYWREDSDFDLAHHFVHLALPAPGRIRELLAMVSRLHGGHLDRAYPLWRVYLIEGLEDGRIAVYVKIHHAVVDGVAGIRLLVKCMATSVEESLRLPPFWEVETMKSDTAQALPVPTPATGGITAVRSLSREGLKSVMPVLRELRRSIDDYRAGNPKLVMGGQAPRCLFNDQVTGTRRFAAQSYSMSRIKAVAKAHGATSNDVILAMCGGALRRYLAEVDTLPEAPLVACVPVSVRRRGSHAAGNEIAFTLTHLATNLDVPSERLVAIKECMDYNKERMQKLSPGQLTAYAATMMMPGALNSVLRRNPHKTLGNVVISHVPGPRQEMYWQGLKLGGLYPLSLIIDGSALNITVVSRRDAVDFGLIACRKTVPHMQRLLDYLEDELAQLEGTAAPVGGAGKGARSGRKARAPKPGRRSARPQRRAIDANGTTSARGVPSSPSGRK